MIIQMCCTVEFLECPSFGTAKPERVGRIKIIAELTLKTLIVRIKSARTLREHIV